MLPIAGDVSVTLWIKAALALQLAPLSIARGRNILVSLKPGLGEMLWGKPGRNEDRFPKNFGKALRKL